MIKADMQSGEFIVPSQGARHRDHVYLAQMRVVEARLDGDSEGLIEAQRDLADSMYDLDVRTTEEIEDDAEAEARAARVFVTGFPARPGTIR